MLARVTKIFTGDSGEPRPEKATILLRKDHDKVRDLFKKFEDLEGRGGKTQKKQRLQARQSRASWIL